jgi:hypothetical protein
MSQIAYWGLALFAFFQILVCLNMKGIWGWIFRFPIAIVGWSACWFIIAKLHNLVRHFKSVTHCCQHRVADVAWCVCVLCVQH